VNSDSSPSSSATDWQQSIYDQLHEIAQRAIKGEAAGHSLQPTLLVNDAYMKLLDQQNVNREDRAQVLAVGANIIRRLLVDYARKRKAEKRGGETGRSLKTVKNDWRFAKAWLYKQLGDAWQKEEDLP
jgi:RNA polymerase sigma-70 factor (ECF subfamily)